MAKQKTIWVNERTMAALRTGDSFSARVNQVVDRYSEILFLDSENVRSLFTAKEWTTLREVERALAAESSNGTPAMSVQMAMARALKALPKLAEKVENLTAGDRFVLLELLESEQMAVAA